MLKFVKRILPKTKRRWLIVIALFLLVATGVSMEITSQPGFCKSCHIMETYHASWQTDVHRNISCVECHIAPGVDNFIHAKLNGLGQVVDDVLNRTSTKPSASVSDFACTRSGCHVLGKLDEDQEKAGERSYHFNHEKHLKLEYAGIGMHCTTCHSHVQGNNHFEVNTNVCIACHMIGDVNVLRPASDQASALSSQHAAAVSSDFQSLTAELLPAAKHPPSNCDACHDAPAKAFEYNGLVVDHSEYLRYGASCNACHRGATATPQPVNNSHCYACHDFGMERIKPTPELHRIHTEGRHKVECFNCHGEIRHGPAAQAMSLGDFDCRECHSAQHMVQRTTYQSGHVTLPNGHPTVPKSGEPVSPMFMAHVDCTACHIRTSALSIKPNSGATVAKASPDACDSCHRPGLGKELVPLWQRNTRELFAQVEELLPTPDELAAFASERAQLVEEARELLNMVRVDGSWGVHNPRYTQRLIEQAREKAIKARAMNAAEGGGM